MKALPDPHPNTPEPIPEPETLAQKFTQKGSNKRINQKGEDDGDPPRAKVSPSAAEPPAVPDDDSCEKRASGGKSELISAEENKKC